MSINKKILVMLVVIALIIVGVLVWKNKKGPASPSSLAQKTRSVGQINGMINIPIEGIVTSPSDTSNSALEKDINSIDRQISGLTVDLLATTTPSN